MGKLKEKMRKRQILFGRQILQENIRWKALDEIYKIYMFLHRSDINTSAEFRQLSGRLQHAENSRNVSISI